MEGGHEGSWRNVKGEGDNTDRELTHRRHTGMVMPNGTHPVSCDTHMSRCKSSAVRLSKTEPGRTAFTPCCIS